MFKKNNIAAILCIGISTCAYASQPKTEEVPLLNKHNNQEQIVPNTVLFKCPEIMQKLKNICSCPIPSFTANRFWQSYKAWRDLKYGPKK